MTMTAFRTSFRTLFYSCVLSAIFGGCNEHPIQPIDEIVTGTNRQENRLPAKTKIDFLFVIDTSGSMAEEQENLSRNFTQFSDFLFNELGASADYRIAVTNMDTQPGAAAGAFLANPAPANVANTADCAGLVSDGRLKKILRSDDVQTQQELEQRFRCMATLGTGGDGVETGLESMRLALSCNGPNASFFGVCCVDDPKVPNGLRKIYNPACSPEEMNAPEPEFLRPAALLVVVLVSDEDDCSTPSLNRAASMRPICRQPVGQQGSDLLPAGYSDQTFCNGLSPEQCYRRDCGEFNLTTCYDKRCTPPVRETSACAWNPEAMTDVVDYARFLERLKAQPAEQLVVATIVGQRAYTPMGRPISYRELPEQDNPLCTPIEGPIDDVPLNLDAIQSDMCCPDGQCSGEVEISCYTSGNGVAYAGTRYLKLGEIFGENSITCPEVTAENVSSEQHSSCQGQAVNQACQWTGGNGETQAGKCRPILDSDQLACSQCVSICEDSFQRPLQQIKTKVSEILSTYCLDKTPVCVVQDGDKQRYCESREEWNEVRNYLGALSVTSQCALTPAEGGFCEVYQEARKLAASEWTLELGAPNCTGGAFIRLNDPPPAGAQINIEYYVGLDGR